MEDAAGKYRKTGQRAMKTIFRKFAYTYVLMFLFAFSVIVVGVRIALSHFFFEQTKNLIVSRIGNVESMANSSGLTLDQMTEYVNILDVYTGATMWIVDADGKVLQKQGQRMGYENLFRDEVSKDAYQSVIRGELKVEKLGGLDQPRRGRADVLRVGIPFKLRNQKLAIFVNIPLFDTERTISRILIIVFLALLITDILAVIMIYFTTNRMSRELELLTHSASQVAAGNFDYRIKTRSSDELALLADAFNKMADDLKKQEQARRNFVSSFSHDIRTPLTTIKGYITGIIDGTIEREKADRYLGTVVSECDRMLQMANEMLDLAKLESGEVSIEKRDFNLSELILNVLDSFEHKISAKNVRMLIDFGTDSAMAHADFSGIQRVVYNLLDNATKFVNEGGTISIKTELKYDKLYVGVGNTGHVLSEEQMSRIWNRFEKLDSSRGLAKRSSGLGLAIVKEIIKAHGEKIEVYSNEEIGVVFVFSLPAQIFERI